MGVEHFEVVERKSHANKQWSSNKIRVWHRGISEKQISSLLVSKYRRGFFFFRKSYERPSELKWLLELKVVASPKNRFHRFQFQSTSVVASSWGRSHATRGNIFVFIISFCFQCNCFFSFPFDRYINILFMSVVFKIISVVAAFLSSSYY